MESRAAPRSFQSRECLTGSKVTRVQRAGTPEAGPGALEDLGPAHLLCLQPLPPRQPG